MGDHVAVIHEDPVRETGPFNAQRLAAFFSQFFFDMLRDGSHLRDVVTGADDKIVGDDADPFQIKDYRVYRLLIRGGACYGECLVPAVCSQKISLSIFSVLYQNEVPNM